MSMCDGEPLTVVDLFCGAGGFSEGFDQMGFDVICGLDSWEPAIETIELNHPGIETSSIDITELETVDDIDEEIPDADVIIGGPPCQTFSRSNKAGKADKTEGLNLIQMMLRIVAWKMEHGDLRYWVLENVPTTEKHIKDEYTWEELRLPGDGPPLEVGTKVILNSADFGVPQTRRRMFCGDFPEPTETHGEAEWLTMREVFEALGSPMDEPSKADTIADPCYDVSLGVGEVTDHHYDNRVEEYRWRRARHLKEDHGYMGRMSFPEELDRPSRTVMATRSASTRESMLFGVDTDGDGEYEAYRLPTVREIASFMSFPIHYQFEAGTEAKKYRLVGNAVPCRMAAAIARAIADAEDLPVPDEPYHGIDEIPDLSVDLTGREWEPTKPRKRRDDAQYYRHIPYMKPRSFRVEIENRGSDFEEGEVVWSTVLHKGQGRRAKATEPTLEEARSLLEAGPIHDGENDPDMIQVDWAAFEADVHRTFDGVLPDAHGFQEVYVHRGEGDGVGPDEALHAIRDIIDEQLPAETYGDVEVRNEGCVDIDEQRIPIRIVAGLLACKHVTDTVMAGEDTQVEPTAIAQD